MEKVSLAIHSSMREPGAVWILQSRMTYQELEASYHAVSTATTFVPSDDCTQHDARTLVLTRTFARPVLDLSIRGLYHAVAQWCQCLHFLYCDITENRLKRCAALHV